jgi:hypothetical protein
MQVGDLTRSWTDALSTASVGSLAIIIPLVTRVNPDGSMSVAVGSVRDFFQAVEGSGQATAIVASIFLVGLALLVGSWLMQAGEFVSILPDIRDGRSRVRKRLAEVESNPALLMIFVGAYSAYRLFCGFGALMFFVGALLIVLGAANAALGPPVIGLLAILYGATSCLIFSRWSFTYIDWIVSGDLKM